MEIPSLAWDAKSIGFWGAVILSFIGGWATILQGRKVWRERSGKSLPTMMFLYSGGLLAIAGIYGLSTDHSAIVINAVVMGLSLIPLLGGLWFIKGFSRYEKLVGVLLLVAVLSTIIIPNKGLCYLIFSFGHTGMMMSQPWNIWKERDRGVVEIRLLITNATSTSFWVIYGVAVNDWVLKIVCPIYLLVLIITLTLWKIFPNKKELPTATED